MMKSNYCTLQSLDLHTKDCKIKVRVSRMWKSINLKNNEIFEINMLLIDEKGDQLMAVVPKFLIGKFQSKIVEGLIFEISNFNVKNQKKTYQVVEKPYKIEFRPNTGIIKLLGDEIKILKYKFDFFSLDQIESRYGNDTCLLDVIGKLYSISNIEEKIKFDEPKSKSWKRDIIIANANGNKVRITLWGDLAKQFDEEAISKVKGPIIIIVTSTAVRIYGGVYFLQSTNATKVYINLEVPEVSIMLRNEETALEESTVQIINKGDSTMDAIVEEKTLEELCLEMKNPDNIGIKFNCHASILQIYDRYGWSYISCPKCKKIVVKTDEAFYCSKCETKITYPILRYKLSMLIEDDSGFVDLVAFDKEAEHLLKYTVKEFTELEAQENGKERIASIFNELVGTKIVFQVKKTEYYINNSEKRKFTANKIQRVCIDPKNLSTTEEKKKEVKYEPRKSKRTLEEENLDKETTAYKRNCNGLE